MAGLREPESGLLLAGGLDRATLGDDAGANSVAAAPQYHENHILAGSLSFNLLMGRQWPPSAEDLEEAETVCRELGLGDLLERMPAGIDQMVGETGWQLSQGERSRVFLAARCLQRARPGHRWTKASRRSIRRICASAWNAIKASRNPDGGGASVKG